MNKNRKIAADCRKGMKEWNKEMAKRERDADRVHKERLKDPLSA